MTGSSCPPGGNRPRSALSSWLRQGWRVAVRHPSWIVLTLAIVMATGSGVTILRLHENALTEVHKGRMLAELHAQTYRMLAALAAVLREGIT